MFALSIFSSRPKPSPPSNPWQWGRQHILDFLDARDPTKEKDRADVEHYLALLGSAIRSECRAPYHDVGDVLRADPRVLPIQLRAYRELYEHMLIWLR